MIEYIKLTILKLVKESCFTRAIQESIHQGQRVKVSISLITLKFKASVLTL